MVVWWKVGGLKVNGQAEVLHFYLSILYLQYSAVSCSLV